MTLPEALAHVAAVNAHQPTVPFVVVHPYTGDSTFWCCPASVADPTHICTEEKP